MGDVSGCVVQVILEMNGGKIMTVEKGLETKSQCKRSMLEKGRCR